MKFECSDMASGPLFRLTAIFKSAMSLHTLSIEILNDFEDISQEECMRMMWSPRGVFLVLFLAFRMCSLNLSRIRLLFPLYTSFPYIFFSVPLKG